MTKIFTTLINIFYGHKYFSAFILGSFLPFSHTPFNIVPLTIVSFSGLLLLSRNAMPKQSFLMGFLFGLGYFGLSYIWVYATVVNREEIALQIIFLVSLLILLGAFFPALILFGVVKSQFENIARVLLFCCFWMIGEWVTFWIFSGFPWSLQGYVWDVHTIFLQPASLGGIWLLSLITLMISCFPSLAFEGRKFVGIGVPLVLFSGVLIFGLITLANNPVKVRDISFSLLQPNVSPKKKWDPDYQEKTLDTMISISNQQNTDHIIWPESAIIAPLNIRPKLVSYVADSLKNSGFFITGAPRMKRDDERWANSIYIINKEGKIRGVYDKHHLVPFGEYVPFFPFVRIAGGREGDYASGLGPKTLHVAGLPGVGPSICFEIIFPNEVVNQNNRPEWILNVANDAWFEFKVMPYQHFMHARLRAVEEGLPLIRLSNSGPSGVIDSYGRVIAFMGFDRAGVLNSFLPVSQPPTLFSKIGNWSVIIIIVLYGIMALIAQSYLDKKRRYST